MKQLGHQFPTKQLDFQDLVIQSTWWYFMKLGQSHNMLLGVIINVTVVDSIGKEKLRFNTNPVSFRWKNWDVQERSFGSLEKKIYQDSTCWMDPAFIKIIFHAISYHHRCCCYSMLYSFQCQPISHKKHAPSQHQLFTVNSIQLQPAIAIRVPSNFFLFPQYFETTLVAMNMPSKVRDVGNQILIKYGRIQKLVMGLNEV